MNKQLRSVSQTIRAGQQEYAKPKVAREKEETGFFEPYSDFAKNLRTWFLAYGIGAPALILSQDKIWQKLSNSPHVLWIACLFLGGVSIQILSTILYKTAMWYFYMGELHSNSKQLKTYKVLDKLSEAYWLELFFDVGTFVAFGVATYMILKLITVDCGCCPV